MKASVKVFMIVFYVLVPAAVFAANDALTLKQAIDTALKQSPLIKSAQYDVEASRQTARGAKGAFFPRLDLNAAYFKENQGVPYIPAQSVKIPAKFSDEVYSWSVFLRMPIYEGGRLVGQVKVAELEQAVQSSIKKSTIQDLIANVTNTFNKLLQLKELRKAYDHSVDALEKQDKDTKFLLKTGRVPNVELLRVEVQLASERQNLIRTEEAINRARDALAFLLGVDADRIKDVEGDLRKKETVKTENIDGLIKARPDVVAAAKKAEAEKARVDVASGKRYPSLDMVSDYGDRAGVGFNGREEVWEAEVVASINIFDAGIISSEIARAEAVYQKARESLRLAGLNARREVSDALSFLREAEGRLTLAEKALSQSKESFRIESLKYKTGAGTITDVLLSESAMSLAQANYYQALYDYSAAVTEFKRATGTIGEGI